MNSQNNLSSTGPVPSTSSSNRLLPFSKARALSLILLPALLLSAALNCLRFEESDFDSTTGLGNLWPLLFVAAADSTFALGQTSTSTVEGIRLGFQRPRHMAIVGDKLIISDEKNRRVLIYNTVPTLANADGGIRVQPDVVLGAPDANTGGIDAYEYPNDNLHINDPTGIASDGTRLFVADNSRNRVLVWNTFPTQSYTPADLVLGQPDFTSGTTLASAANTMNGPQGIAICGTKLFVADNQNHRVMVWNTLPTTTQQAADFVLGQTNFTNNTPLATGATTLNSPVGVHCTATQLFVADRDNNRVLIWNTIPTTMGAGANVAVGQVGLAAAVPATSQNGLSNPGFVHAGSNNKLYVSDTANNRLMIYDPIPTTSGPNAAVVLGQNNFSNNAQDNTSLANGVDQGGDVFLYNGHIHFVDANNNRMMIWTSDLPATFAAADAVLGHPNKTSEAPNNPGLSASSFGQTVDVFSDGTRLYVSSDENHRTVKWNSIPTATTPADIVLGQPSFATFTANNPTIGADTLSQPAGGCIADGRLFIADASNNRVLIWNTTPESNQTGADLVLGQANFTSSGSGITISTMDSPFGIYCDSQRLIVADTGNNRVLIWNSLPTTSSQTPDVVIGQVDFVSNAAAGGANGLSSPRAAIIAEGKLMIADSANHRVLIFNSIPTTNGASADLVLGQSDFTSVSVNAGSTTISASGMNSPSALAYVKGALIVSELFNHRLVIYRSIPSVANQTPELVYGQPDFTSGLPNNGGLTGQRFNVPFGMYYDETTDRLFLADVFNYRVVGIPANSMGL